MTKIPCIEVYRGVGLHDQQSPARLEVVRGEIDAVFAIVDIGQLAKWADNWTHSPESRLLASALCEARWHVAAQDRKLRPDVDLDQLRASVIGLDSVEWRDPFHYCSLFDGSIPPLGQGSRPVERDEELRA
jgi:hypothetical protein